MNAVARIHPVILSGGSGSRLWPLSRRMLPKQFLALAGDRTMLQETATRFVGSAFASLTVICNGEHRFFIAEQLREVGLGGSTIVLEPEGRNTAPAACTASLAVAESNPEGLILLAPSDHVIGEKETFRAAIATARPAADSGKIVVFGIEPRGPETGYGYVFAKGPIDGARGCRAVRRFVEKPDSEKAKAYITEGDCYWNAGIFLFKASVLLAEFERLNPAILAACKTAFSKSRRDLDFVRLDEESFRTAPSLSLDVAVMEKTSRAAVIPVDMGWSDVGSWQALWEISAKDSGGNVTQGDVLIEGVKNSYLRSDGPLLAAVGVEDLVVVATPDAVLVAHRGAAQDVKKIVDELERRGREHHVHHRRVFRPWGSYESIDLGDRFQVKRIRVAPGQKLSLQMHNHRAEHWVVVGGVAKVTRGDEEFLLQENQSTFIPLGTRHRLENPGEVMLDLIEVQSGSYLGEDDIVRFDDAYGRASAKGG